MFSLKQLSILISFFCFSLQAEPKQKSLNTQYFEPESLETFVEKHFCNQGTWSLFWKCANSKRVNIYATLGLPLTLFFFLTAQKI